MKFARRLSLLIVSALIAPLAVIAAGTSANAVAAVTGSNTFSSAPEVTTKTSTGSTVGADKEGSGGTAEYDGSGEQATIWFKWTPTVASSTVVDTCSSAVDNSLAIYTSAEVTSGYPTSAPNHTGFTPGTCSSAKGKKFTFTPSISGTHTYYIQVRTSIGGGTAGAVTLVIDDGVLTDGGGGGGTPPPSGLPTLTKVTLCHRTHSLTNPYVLVTVSVNSVVKDKGHGSHNSDSKHNAASQQGIFKGADAYPKMNQKFWGDIIPSFKYDDGGTIKTYAGLNWKWNDITDGNSNNIFSKTEFRAIDKTAGTATAAENAALELCRGAAGQVAKSKTPGKLSAKDLYDDARKYGSKDDAKNEVDDTLDPTSNDPSDPSDDDLPSTINDDLKKELPPGEGPKKQPTNVPDQSLSGNVWLDLNSNGYQEDDEPNMPNIKVTVTKTEPNVAGRLVNRFENTGGGKQVVAAIRWATQFPVFASLSNNVKSLFRTVTTYTVLTDGNGWYLFKSIGAGDWTAVGVVPDGLYVTYDSSELSDASVDATVPVSGHAHTWIGLVGPSGIKSKVTNPDGTPVTKLVTVRSAGDDGKFCTADDVQYEVTPVDGVIQIDGLSAGKYSVVKIGTKSTIGDFTVGDSTYTTAISTKSGTKCKSTSSAALAATGMTVTKTDYSLIAFAVLMITSGVAILRRKQRGNHAA